MGATDKVLTSFDDIIQGKELSGLTGSGCYSHYTSFEGSDSFFKYIRSGVHDTGVDVSKFLQGK